MLKHRRLPKIRQLLPIGVFGMNVFGVGSGLVVAWPFLLPSLAYAGACLAGGAFLALSNRDPAGLAAGPAAMVMHQSWAAGFVYRAFKTSFGRASRASASEQAYR